MNILARIGAAALSLGLSTAAGPVINYNTAAPSGNVTVSNVPATITGNGSWTSVCLYNGQLRAFDAFVGLSAVGTVQIQRYADALCTYPVGSKVPSTALTLTTSAACPSSGYCGDVGSNDGLPFLAFEITVTDTSGSTNTVKNVTVTRGAE